MNRNIISTAVGLFELIDDGEQIISVLFMQDGEESRFPSALAVEFKKQFSEYLEGSRKNYQLPFLIQGTEFQKAVLMEMSKIPYGSTMSYKELASKAGYPNAYRAVGTVCKTNSLPFILPCHRVIKNDGSMGFYGGGESLKELFLSIEAKNQS